MNALRTAAAAIVLAPIPALAAEPPVVVESVSHIGFSVSDMDRAFAFFRDVLGATMTEPQSYPKVSSDVTGISDADIVIAYAVVAGQRIELIYYANPGGVPSRLEPPDPGHVHLGIVVQDFFAMADRLRNAGFVPRVSRTPGPGRARPAYFYGFDGLVIELIQQR